MTIILIFADSKRNLHRCDSLVYFLLQNMGSDVLPSTTIRSRHSEIYQKLRGLKTAVDEHFQNIKVRVDYGELTRPTSSVYRAPKYVTLLSNNVKSEVASLRATLNMTKQDGQCSEGDYYQLDKMVSDLELFCQRIFKKMTTQRYTYKEPEKKSENLSPHNDSFKPICTSTNSGSPGSESDCSTITLPKLESPPALKEKLSPQFMKPVSECSSSTSLVPIGSENSGQKKDILKRQSSDNERKERPYILSDLMPKCQSLQLDKPKKVTFSNGTRENNSPRRGFLFRQTSNLGYPYGSSFPALPPVPTRRRFVTQNASLAKNLQSPLEGSVFSKREKSWLY